MERIWIYLLAVMDILLGFAILHRSADRFGFDTYQSFLNRQEREQKKEEGMIHSGNGKKN